MAILQWPLIGVVAVVSRIVIVVTAGVGVIFSLAREKLPCT